MAVVKLLRVHLSDLLFEGLELGFVNAHCPFDHRPLDPFLKKALDRSDLSSN